MLYHLQWSSEAFSKQSAKSYKVIHESYSQVDETSLTNNRRKYVHI